MKVSSDLIQNDVPAIGQIEESDSVSFRFADHADLKILFLGNSITRHGRAEELFWYGDWGMAASSRETDYVHRLVTRLERDGRKVSYCVANLSEWERTRDMSLLGNRYAPAKKFGADIAVVRLGENARLVENLQTFRPRYRDLAELFASDGARVVLTDLFWEYEPFDRFVKELAEEKGYAFVQLHDLGALDEMKAIGAFEHAGVAAHPGDKGMEQIAERIYRAIKE
ncbi:MAG: SGNH/GDSL hydrolase family protein [Clostridia bacterium]|nr:SGNH/GDSL hydrolase family protein [Clostridia bacterium]